MSATATVLSIIKKLVKWDKKLNIYTNGEDNAYPERMARYRSNSVTASMASKVMVQFLIGKGFGTHDDTLIDGRKLSDLADDIARDLTDERAVAIHVSYNANYEPSSWRVIPAGDIRLGEKDSKDYNGKILVYNDWHSKNIKASDIAVYDVFNPKKEVVAAQVAKAKGKDELERVENYRGQVFYFNMDRQFYYPLARIDAVAFDCDNEYHAGNYKNVILREGFYGKTLVITRPLIGASLYADTTKEGKAKLAEAESERTKFKAGISQFVGIKGAGGVMHIEVEFGGEDLKNAVVFQNIESKIDDKLFEFTENSSMQKILMAYNNMPKVLVMLADSAMFGTSGEALRIAKETYWENTAKERAILETIVNDFMKLINPTLEERITVLPLLAPAASVPPTTPTV